MISRILAFLRGDMGRAEDLGALPAVPIVDWIAAASVAGDEAVVNYALDAAQRSAEDANSAVKGLQDKAAGLLTLLIGLVPLLIAAMALSASRSPESGARWLALALFVGAGITMIGAIVMAALASGLTMGGGLNLARLNKGGGAASIVELKSTEADAWHYAAMLAMEAATRKARDLFQARQLMLWALTLSIAGSAVLLVSVGGNLGELTGTPSPSLCSIQKRSAEFPARQRSYAITEPCLSKPPPRR